MLTPRMIALTLPVLFLAGRPVVAEEAAAERAVIDRAIRAAGGEARLARFKAAEWTCKGTAHASIDLTFTDHCFAQWPEQFRHESVVEARGEKLERALILDGEHGWIKDSGGRVVLNDTARDELRDKLHLLHLSATLLPLKDRDITLKRLDDTKIEGRTAVGVSVRGTGHPDLRLYFDKEKGLLLQCRRTVKDPLLGEVSEETSFGDYQEVEGVQVAHAVSVKRGGKPFIDWTITDFQMRAKLDRKLFAAP